MSVYDAASSKLSEQAQFSSDMEVYCREYILGMRKR